MCYFYIGKRVVCEDASTSCASYVLGCWENLNILADLVCVKSVDG
jgi:hypothetical protein